MTPLDLDQVATFVAVVDTGNFGKAAGHRGLSQGAVSQQIGKLENQLGARLLVRSSRACEPTPAGADFAHYARALLRLSHRAQTVVRQRSAAFGASSNIGIYLLQPYLKAFLDMQQDIELQVRIAANPEIAGLLEDGELDAAVMEWWDERPGFSARLWRRESLVAIVAPDHPWATLPEISPELLERTPLLGGEAGTGTGRILAEYLGKMCLPTAQQLGSTEAVKQWVRAGLGVSIVLEGTVVDEVTSGNLRAIPLAGEPPSKPLYAVWRRALPETSPALQFVDFLTRSKSTAKPLGMLRD